MQPLYLLTAVDVRRATEANTSRATTISKLAFPSISFAGSEHNPGGGVTAVNLAQPRLEALEPKFEAKGIDLDIFRGMGKADRWTFAGAYREKKPGGGSTVGGRGIIEGAVTMWEPDESDPAEFQGCNHSFTEVTHFEFHIGDKELLYVDFWERILRVDGVDLFADERRALGASGRNNRFRSEVCTLSPHILITRQFFGLARLSDGSLRACLAGHRLFGASHRVL